MALRLFYRLKSYVVIRIMVFVQKKYKKDIIKEQNEMFCELGVSRLDGIDLINKICRNEFYCNYDETNGMFSEHLVLLSSISLAKNDYNQILEIGTFDGKCSLILSRLFQDSKIDTIDLPQNSKVYKNTYHRKTSFDQFVRKRNENLKKSDRINFIEMNSVELTNYKRNTYDLIWVDGAHGYPVVAIDILNACRLIRKDGIILLDDVHLNVKKSDSMYSSIATYEMLNLLKDTNIISDFKLIKKRLDVKFNIKNYTEKFIGVIKF